MRVHTKKKIYIYIRTVQLESWDQVVLHTTDFAAYFALTTTLDLFPLTTTQAPQCDHSSVVLCMRVSMDTITVGTKERAKFEGAYDH
jgi:hypothetical protein